VSTPVPSAFISYSREDSEFALRLAKDLKAAGAQVWLDQIDIKPGRSWDNAVEDALLESPQMLVVLSPSAARSENVRNEISFALEQGKIVVPVLYRDCVVPLRLQRTQRIDFRADYALGLASLLDQLRVEQPNQDVLDKAAEDDAQRQAAWQAREAEAQRLRDLAGPAQPPSRRNRAVKTTVIVFAVVVVPIVLFLFRLQGLVLISILAVGTAMLAFGCIEGPPQPATRARRTRIVKRVLAALGGLIVVFGLYAVTLRGDDYFEYQPSRQLARIQHACDSGVADQCEALGYRYSGTFAPSGYPKDVTREVAAYQKACDGGLSSDCETLGDIYYKGDGVPKDAAKSAVLYQRACDGGNIVGCANLGWDYDYGTGVAKDLGHAAAFFKKACDGGQNDGCDGLGFLYANGTGVAKDPAIAAALWQKACGSNQFESCLLLGNLYSRGTGVPKDLARSASLEQKACDGGAAWGCNNLAYDYENGAGVAVDLSKAKQLYQKACSQGLLVSCTALTKNAKLQ
jgi:TPR repeat protein